MGEIGGGSRMDKNADLTTWEMAEMRLSVHRLSPDTNPHRPWSFQNVPEEIQDSRNKECKYCRAIDTVAHTLFPLCPRWHTQRQTLHTRMGTADLTTENFLEVMIMEKKKWKNIHNFIRTVMTRTNGNTDQYCVDDYTNPVVPAQYPPEERGF
ncbi:hypothetical protein JTB14_012020 [Gonioctena quinquepunctata]|nr:hypothetical protein JTB14_012020 [Gonioctena quinquepunctata]